MHGIVNLMACMQFVYCIDSTCVVFVMRSVLNARRTRQQTAQAKQNEDHPFLLITAPTSVYGSSIIRYHSLDSNVLCTSIQWLARQQE